MGGKILLGLCSLLTLSLGPLKTPSPSPVRSSSIALTVVANAPGEISDRYLALAAVSRATRKLKTFGDGRSVIRRLSRDEPVIRRRLDRLLAADGAPYRAHVLLRRNASRVARRWVPELVVRLGRGRGGVWRGLVGPSKTAKAPLGAGRVRVSWRLPRFLRGLGRLI